MNSEDLQNETLRDPERFYFGYLQKLDREL